MGNAAGIIRDKNIRILDRRLNADRGKDEILDDLKDGVPLTGLIQKPRNIKYAGADGIKQSWLDPTSQDDFFTGVPDVTRDGVLRSTFIRALELRKADPDDELRKIRTVWICLWDDPANRPLPFGSAVLESKHEITVLLLAFRAAGLTTGNAAVGQDRVHIFARDRDMFRLFGFGEKDSLDDTVKEKVLGDDPTL